MEKIMCKKEVVINPVVLLILANKSEKYTSEINCILNLALETEKQQYFKEVLNRLEIDFPKLLFFKDFGWIYTACACKNNVVTWADKSRGKWGRISEEHSKCGRLYKKI